jgi:sugar phosphate isomerase/epimerase
MQIAFSTCWNSVRHVRGDTMLQEIVDLGFSRVELGHGIRGLLLEGIDRFVADHEITITSLLNYCPLPIDESGIEPDCFHCLSHREKERQRAQTQTCQTIDYAAKVGAKAVVVHLGSVPLPPFSARLIDRIKSGRYLDRGYVRLKLAAIRKREAIDSYQRVLDWLYPVFEHARNSGVRLGVENRFGIETFPSEREFRRLFQDLTDDSLGYWHDFGHAQIRHNLTFVDHPEWLAEMVPRLIGCHVHDVQFPDRDHLPIFSGMIPFRELLRKVPAGIPLVWELDPRVPPAEVTKALREWNKTFASVV